MKKHILVLILLSVTVLSGCIPFMVAGGTAIGAWIGSDPRKSETIKMDFDLGAEISGKIIDAYKGAAHVNVNVFNGLVLLTGEVSTEAALRHISQIASGKYKGYKARKVLNECIVAPTSSLLERANDSQITARVKTSILAQADDASSIHIMVTTEHKVVYLMGIAKPEVADQAAISASKVGGVLKVVKLFEYNPKGPRDDAPF